MSTFTGTNADDMITPEEVSPTATTNQGSGGDRQVDTVSVQGTPDADTVAVSRHGNDVVVSGLATPTTIDHADKADRLVINTAGGNDTIDASNLGKSHIGLQIIGGPGNDLITGSDGDDSFVWNPGDGSDTIDGRGGSDTLVFNGANVAENVNITANGSGVLFTRNVASITMDLKGIEKISSQPSAAPTTSTSGT